MILFKEESCNYLFLLQGKCSFPPSPAHTYLLILIKHSALSKETMTYRKAIKGNKNVPGKSK